MKKILFISAFLGLTLAARAQDAYLGEIRIFAGSYAPRGWLVCSGQTLSIRENQALFSLLGTTYGGDGKINFKLPDLSGAGPVGVGNSAGVSVAAGQVINIESAAVPARPANGTAPARFDAIGTNFIICVSGNYPQ